jgi:5-methylcytosine-specific restriction enzyme subunit McrC
MRHRFQLVEYGASVDLVGQLVVAAAIDRDKAKRLVSDAGERAARSLRMAAAPLQNEGTGIRAVDFAGMIRLGPGLELEVGPKFLGRDELNSRWWEDFFYFLVNLSRHGRLLASERLRASGRAPKDLASLIARSVTGMYWDSVLPPCTASSSRQK